MEKASEKSTVVSPSGVSHPDLRTFIEKSRRFLNKIDACGECRLEVEKQGRWFILRGQVDSQPVKSRLIGMVPKVEGAQWIVDRLHVHSLEGKGQDG
jgi:hypothetical protein